MHRGLPYYRRKSEIFYYDKQLDGIHHWISRTGTCSFFTNHFFLVLYMKCHDYECLCICYQQGRYYEALQNYNYKLSPQAITTRELLILRTHLTIQNLLRNFIFIFYLVIRCFNHPGINLFFLFDQQLVCQAILSKQFQTLPKGSYAQQKLTQFFS